MQGRGYQSPESPSVERETRLGVDRVEPLRSEGFETQDFESGLGFETQDLDLGLTITLTATGIVAVCWVMISAAKHPEQFESN